MRKYPCSQCKYQATTQKTLKTHVPIVHNHPPWLTDIVTVIVRATDLSNLTRCSCEQSGWTMWYNFYHNNFSHSDRPWHIDQTLSLTYIALPSIAVVKAYVLKQSETISQSVFTINARQTSNIHSNNSHFNSWFNIFFFHFGQ